MSQVPVDGGFLFTQVDSPSNQAPWLVLSNGIATDLRLWDTQIAALSKTYRVLRYDTRGHGRSSRFTGPFDFSMLTRDVVMVLNYYEIARTSFLGLSLGGMTGLGLALHHPDRLSALICCNARADAPAGFVQSWDDRLAAIQAGGMAAIVSGTLERWLSRATREANPTTVAGLTDMILGTTPEGFAGCAAALKELDFLRHLGAITTPTLYVAGAADTGAPVEAMRAMAEATPGAEVAVVPRAAHISNLDNPGGFIAAIESFLGLDETGARPITAGA